MKAFFGFSIPFAGILLVANVACAENGGSIASGSGDHSSAGASSAKGTSSTKAATSGQGDSHSLTSSKESATVVRPSSKDIAAQHDTGANNPNPSGVQNSNSLQNNQHDAGPFSDNNGVKQPAATQPTPAAIR